MICVVNAAIFWRLNHTQLDLPLKDSKSYWAISLVTKDSHYRQGVPTPIIMYYCDYSDCAYRTTLKHNMKAHMKTKKHSQRGSFQCFICHKKQIFQTEQSLQNHRIRRHGTKILKKMFKEFSVTQMQMKIYEGEKIA